MFDIGGFLEYLKQNKKAGASQQAVGEMLGISQAYVSQIVKGDRPFKKEYLDLFYENYEKDMVDMFISKNDITPAINFSKGVPYYDVDFIGGFDLVLNDQTTTPAYMIDFQMYNSSDCWCNVTGHSMEPAISNGDIIALKEVQDWTTFLPFGEIYAIVTTEHRTIKKISAGHDHNFFTLIPLNKSIEYQPQEIPKSIILKVYKVMGCMKKL